MLKFLFRYAIINAEHNSNNTPDKGGECKMFKIGFYDYYLDEWHANNYPAMFRKEIAKRSIDMEVCYAIADTDKPGGISTKEWCKKYNCINCSSIEEFVDLCDAIIILAPSFPSEHERMAKLPLASGKPVYIDKIFSPDVITGRRIFEYANMNKTPLFSASALRFCDELADYRAGEGMKAIWCATTGPNSFDIYAIHQIEMIQTVMGGCAQRVKAFGNKGGRTLLFDYGNRMASMLQLDNLPFQVTISDGEKCINRPINSNFFENLIKHMIDFFINPIPPVAKNDTLSVMAMLHTARSALKEQDNWFNITM